MVSRSEHMARVRQKGTTPELQVRRALTRLGYRYRLNARKLPGSPDIVLGRIRTVIFVHGCFWHRHPGCRASSVPKTNAEFWRVKFTRNIERDREKSKALEALGWRVIVIWECETRSLDALNDLLCRYLVTKGGDCEGDAQNFAR